MKIEKAIEIKEHYQYLLQDASLPDLITADNLSIEALKMELFIRKQHPKLHYTLLPGETEE